MRWTLAAVLVASAHAHADDIAVGAAIGAGGQGDAGYGALELRMDAEWHGVRIGLGGRAVVEGGALRTREWSRPIDAIALIRQLEAHLGPVAVAAGALAPSTIGHVAEGYRAVLDDRARTGARLALVTRGLDNRARLSRDGDRDQGGGARIGGDRDGGDGDRDRSGGGRAGTIDLEGLIEIDDVLDPALVGGALAWQFVPAWGFRAATAVDPATSRVAIEVGGVRRWEREDSRVDLGASFVGERWLSGAPDSPANGQPIASEEVELGAVGFASAAFDRAGARWTFNADLRAGTGTNGAAFGPLYRAERTATTTDSPNTSRAILYDVRSGIGGGLATTITSDRGWLSLGGRWRPGLGALGMLNVGAPMGRYLQAAGWIAASSRATAGAAELRAVWATHYSSSIQIARMYTDATSAAMSDVLAPVWSATVWFAVSTR